jgi:predicted thioesterase
MAKTVPLGVRGEIEEKVEHRHTLNHHNPALPPIFSTPHMIGLMEQAAFLALAPYGDPSEISVGTAINIEHRAATGIGATVKAEAVLESQKGRFYVFRVTAHNGEKEIGRGTVTRAFVNPGIIGRSPQP